MHSPGLRGFWWAHVGWVISNDYDDYDPSLIRDFAKFPELRWLDRYHWVPTALLGAVISSFGGLGAFLWGYVLSTVVLYHATFCINSLAHVWGTRRFATPDESRNNFVLALVTLGEGWHNNHHRFMYACRQGILWWEVDFTYYALRVLAWLGSRANCVACSCHKTNRRRAHEPHRRGRLWHCRHGGRLSAEPQA